MNLYLFDEREIVLFNLPEKIIGNFWMTDNNEKNVVNISANENRWIISGGNNSKIIFNGNYVESTVLNVKYYYIIEKDNKQFVFVF